MIGEIDYYEEPSRDYRERFEPGSFYIAPIPYLLSRSTPRLRVDYYDPSKPYNSSYTVEQTDMASFRPGDDDPIYELKLSSEEFVLCVAYKLRPVIALTHDVPVWRDRDQKYADCLLVVPSYGARDEAGNYRFSEQFMLRVQAYEYASMFYLPENVSFGIRESIARFDRIAAVRQDVLRPQPKRLTGEATECITNWFQYFVGAELDELLYMYRELALSELDPATESAQ
jgi:hypothetical protein